MEKIKELTTEQKEKRSQLIGEIKTMITGHLGEHLGINPHEFPMEKDLIDLFNGDKLNAASSFVALQQYFGVKQKYEELGEFNSFDNVDEFGIYLTYYVLKKEGLLTEDEIKTEDEEAFDLY